MNHQLPNRREVLAVLGAASVLPAGSALASPVHTLSVGAFEITILSDGHLTVPTRFLARNATEFEIKSAIGISADTVAPPCNVTLLRTPSEHILVDVGAGPHFMAGAGKLAENMDAAGIDRKLITKVVFTHAHPDHLWGALDDFDEAPMFPNATYLISAAELSFWTADDVAVHLPGDRQNFAPGAKRNLSRIKDRLEAMQPDQEVASGVRVLDTSGHTAGHVSIEISAGRDAVVVLGDALTHSIISFAHPEWMPTADHHDPQRAAAMRKRLLDRLATDRLRVIGFHLPFPGVGIAERSGAAYRFVPT